MTRRRWGVMALRALTPLPIQMNPHGDSSATVTLSDGTRLEVYGGAGEYAFISRGCEGAVAQRRPVSFHDVGGAIEQGLGATGVSIGARGGWMKDDFASTEEGIDPGLAGVVIETPRDVIENKYVNPYITYEKPGGSVGLGWVIHDKEFITAGEHARTEEQHQLNDFSGHLRMGSERRYFAVRWMESVPIYSGGGYLTIGVGGHPAGGPLSLCMGLAAGGPYEGAGIVIQTDYPVADGLNVVIRSRLGWCGGEDAVDLLVGGG